MENYTIDKAIEECNEFAKETNMYVGDPHAAKIAEWLTELKGLKDETPITAEFLDKNFESDIDDGEYGWKYKFVYLKLYSNTCIATMDDTKIDIYTIGQLRMFLTICGLTELVKNLKS